MRKHNLHTFTDAAQTCQAAAREVVKIGQQAIEQHDRFLLVLAGGLTPVPLYKCLANRPLRDELDWARVEFFWGDERPVAPDDAEANFHLAKQTLLEPLNIADEKIHRPCGEEADLQAAAEAYQNEIANVVGIPTTGEPPTFDLVLLGLGDDGHTASLYPATPALLETRQWVTANRVLKLDSTRLTMTPMVINRAANILFLVTGDHKATALADVLQGHIDTQRLPAQLIRPAAGNVQWFVDEPAASKLADGHSS